MPKYFSLRKDSFFICLFIFIVALCLFVFFYANDFQYSTFKTAQYTNKYFNSYSTDPNISGMKSFSIKENIKVEQTDISFQMKVYEIDNYNNIFQTAPTNSGIRMELAQPSKLGLIIGYKNAEGVKGFVLRRSLQLKQWYSVNINISRDKHLRVLLNNVAVVDLKDSAINYDISDVAIGAGFSKKRLFKGEIVNFDLKYKFAEKDPVRTNGALIVEIILSIILVFISKKIINIVRKRLRPYGKRIIGNIESFCNDELFIKENLLLLHLFICSVGLIYIFAHISVRVYEILFIHSAINFNEWVLDFYNLPYGGSTIKPKELFSYLFVCGFLFVYYALVYLLIYGPVDKLRKTYFEWVTNNRIILFSYIALLFAVNVFVTYFYTIFNSFFFVMAHLMTWLIVLIIPLLGSVRCL